MAVVANISVLLSARIENYRSQIGFARRDNESFARSAVAAGLRVRDAGKAMDALRQRSFELLTTQQKLNEEIQAIGHLFRSGIIDQQNYAKAINQVNQAYQQKAAAEAAKAQDSYNNAVQRGTQLLRPQIAAQKEAMAEYKRTVAALNALQQSGTAARLGITAEEIENRRREAFLVGQAKFQGRETPAQIQEQARIATEAATAAVAKFNDRFATARQRLRETVNELRTLREQAEQAGKPLDIQAQQQFVRKAIEDYRRDSGLADRLRREQKAQDELNQSIQRGIQLMDKNFSARQRLGQQLRDLQAAAKADPDRFGGQKLEEARRAAFQAFRAETQQSTQLAAASVDKFNQRFVTARQRLRETINELRVLREQAAQAGRVLDRGAQAQFVRKAVEDFRRDSGLDAKLRDEAKARDMVNQAAQRGLQLVDQEFATNQRRRQQLLQQLADINAAREAYKGLDVRKFAAASRGIFDELNAIQEGRESPAAIAERKAAELAANKARIERENVTAIKASQTAEQFRAQEYARINEDIINGLNAEAAARRRLAVDTEFNRRTGVDQRQQIETDLVNRYNEAIQRGIQIARPAKAATDEYRQTLKDLGKALQAAKINQQEYNLARLQAQRVRQDASINPIIQSGINQVAPYRQVLQTVTRSLIDMRAAVQSGKVTQDEYNRTLLVGITPTLQLARVVEILEARYKKGRISVLEYAAALRQARVEILGKTTLLQRLTSTLGVFRTVLIGMAGAQLYSGIFTAFSDAFEFEPKIRRAIALFGELEESQKSALRSVVIAETFNNVPILDRVQVLEELAKDGVDAEVAIRSLGKTLAFASVSGLNAENAVSKVSEVLNAYRLQSGDATEDTLRLNQIMDLLQTSALQTASDVEQVAEALIRTAPQANQLGISMREAAKGVISLSEVGRKGEVGGNELAIALRDLAIKATENKQAFADLGVTFFETDGFFVGMETSIRQLSEALAGLTPEQRTTTLLTIGVTQKASQFQQQLISLVDELRDAKTAFEDTNGAVDRLQRESMTELVFLTNNVKSAFTLIVNSTIVAFFESLAGWINNMNTQTRSLIASLVAFFVITSGFAAVAASIATIIAAIKLYNAQLIITNTLTILMVALAGPKGWLAIAAAIAIAAGAAAGMYYAWGQLEAAMTSSSGVQNIQDNVDRLSTAIKAGRQEADALRASMVDVFDSIQLQFNNEGFTQLDSAIQTVKSDIAKASAADIADAEQSVLQLQAMITAFFNQNRENISDDALKRYFDDLNSQIRNVSRAMETFDVAKIKELREEFARIVDDVRTPLEKAFEEVNRLAQIKEAKLPISPVIERRKLDQILDELAGTIEQEAASQVIKLNAAAEIRGSQAEFSSRVTVRSDDRQRSEQRIFNEKSLKFARDQALSLEDIRTLLEEMLLRQDEQEQIRIGEY